MTTAAPPPSEGPARAPGSPSEPVLEPIREPVPAPVPAQGGAPPVVAIMVTRNAGPFLEASLAALGAQHYPSLTVLVVDAGSERDPTPRVSAVLPSAFVRRVGGDPGFARAANEVLAAVESATFVLVCHDDVVLDPDAVQVMVEEAYRSNAAIVGPKLVDAHAPDILLEVGRAIDRFGGSHTGIESGELDQEQHDGVRDVFYVSSAAMLVRADLFRELGGFDPDTFPGSEDLDVCWRARLAGARVMVAPDALARHYEAAAQRSAGDIPSQRRVARARVRVLLTCYSRASLAFVVPMGLVVSLLEAVVLLPTRRRAEANAAVGAWWWNVVRFRRVRPARRLAQARRAIHDSDLRELQVGAGARVSAFLAHRHADERLQSLGERGRDFAEAIGDAMRTPAAFALLAALVVLVFGSRDLFSSGVPSIGTLVPWPGVNALIAEFTSAWRHTGLGSTAQAPPVLVLMAGMGTVLLGGVGLAQSLLVAGSFVLGGAGAYRLARTISAGPAASAAAALVYVFVPLPRNAIANGRLGPLVLYAVLPFLVVLVVRAGRFGGVSGPSRRPLVGLAIATAFTAAFAPASALAPIVVAVALLGAAALVGGGSAAVRALGAALAGLVGAAVLLVPWTATVFDSTHDLAALGVGFHPRLDLAGALRFETGPSGAGLAPWGLVVAAGLALVLARGPMFAWAVRAWMLVVVGVAVVWLPSRLAPDTAVLAPEAGLSIAALGMALAAAIAVGAVPITRRQVVDDEETVRIALALAAAGRDDAISGDGTDHGVDGPRSGTGIGRLAGRDARRRALVVIAVVGVVFGGFGFIGDSFNGRWGAPDSSWVDALAFTRDAPPAGGFRVLWVGDPDVMPFEPVDRGHGFGWVLTRGGPGDARDVLRAPFSVADAFIERSLVTAFTGGTARLGRLLATAGVRYVALPLLSAPGGAAGRPVPAVTAALSDQLDLARLRSDEGLVLYENESWVPTPAVVTGTQGDLIPAAEPGAPPPSLSRAAAIDLTGAEAIDSNAPVAAGQVLLGEAYGAGWQADGTDGTLAHSEAFGVTNIWDNPRAQPVVITHEGQMQRYLLTALQALLWLGALVWWGLGRRRARGARVAGVRRERRERASERIDPVVMLADDDDNFWNA